MKKCPYCAEEIQDAAIVCRYCGRDLNRFVQINSSSSSINNQLFVEPNPLASIFFGFLLVLILDVWGFFYAFWGLETLENVDEAIVFLNIGARIFLGILSVNGFKPVGAKTVNYIGMILLAFVPIGSWITLYYAGKAIARRVSVKKTLLFGVILILTIVAFVLSISKIYEPIQSVALNPSSTPTSTGSIMTRSQPTNTIIIKKSPSITPTVDYGAIWKKYFGTTPPESRRATSTPSFQPCYEWYSINTDYAGEYLCVYGVYYQVQGSIISFAPLQGTFRISLNDKILLPEGSCVVVTGVLVDNGGRPVITINNHENISSCADAFSAGNKARMGALLPKSGKYNINPDYLCTLWTCLDY